MNANHAHTPFFPGRRTDLIAVSGIPHRTRNLGRKTLPNCLTALFCFAPPPKIDVGWLIIHVNWPKRPEYAMLKRWPRQDGVLARRHVVKYMKKSDHGSSAE